MLLPTAQALGVDPVHFGVIAVFNIMLGLITPPYAARARGAVATDHAAGPHRRKRVNCAIDWRFSCGSTRVNALRMRA